MGYNNSLKCIQLITGNIKNWDQVKIIVFDAPQEVDKTYMERLNILNQAIPNNHTILNVVCPIICRNREHFDTYFNEISKFGEGIIIRKPSAWYFEKNSFFSKEKFVETTIYEISPGYFKWPNGEIHLLQITGKHTDPYIIVRHPFNQPERSFYVSSIRSRKDLFRDFFHFYISNPHSGSQCRGCGKIFYADVNCIQTQLIYNSTYQTISFCLTKSCLEKGLKRYKNQHNTCKPYCGIIWIQEKKLREVSNYLIDVKWEIIPDDILV